MVNFTRRQYLGADSLAIMCRVVALVVARPASESVYVFFGVAAAGFVAQPWVRRLSKRGCSVESVFNCSFYISTQHILFSYETHAGTKSHTLILGR